MRDGVETGKMTGRRKISWDSVAGDTDSHLIIRRNTLPCGWRQTDCDAIHVSSEIYVHIFCLVTNLSLKLVLQSVQNIFTSILLPWRLEKKLLLGYIYLDKSFYNLSQLYWLVWSKGYLWLFFFSRCFHQVHLYPSPFRMFVTWCQMR